MAEVGGEVGDGEESELVVEDGETVPGAIGTEFVDAAGVDVSGAASAELGAVFCGVVGGAFVVVSDDAVVWIDEAVVAGADPADVDEGGGVPLLGGLLRL